jgi:hypothetical protein
MSKARKKPIPLLSARDEQLLLRLRAFCDPNAGRWARPMDLGAWDASWHSRSLRKMVRMGLVEKRTRGSARSFEYRPVEQNLT